MQKKITILADMSARKSLKKPRTYLRHQHYTVVYRAQKKMVTYIVYGAVQFGHPDCIERQYIRFMKQRSRLQIRPKVQKKFQLFSKFFQSKI